MGRMWQTIILSKWNPVFAWIPVETIVKKNQKQYYDAISQSDHIGNSTPFIVFMLQSLLESIKETEKSNQKSNPKIIEAISKNNKVTIQQLQEIVGLSECGIKKNLRKLCEQGIIIHEGARNGGMWKIIK